MRKELKAQIIEAVAAQIAENPNFYLADIAGLNAENTSALRRACFEKGIKLEVVKNTLLKKALEKAGNSEIESLYPTLEGNTAIMFTTTPSAPAKVIKEFGAKFTKPELKGAYLQECAYVGSDKLGILVGIKSREEMIGDIIGLLQSPIRRVISALEDSKKEAEE